ncbi:MAG: serine hydrolase [Pseudomonadales bacterium]
MPYVPDGQWETVSAAAAGFSRNISDALIAAEKLEIDAPLDLNKMLPKGKRHPNDRPLGPVKDRGRPSGVVIRNGYLVAQYGDINAADVTFSASKSYISAVAGMAFARGLINDLDEPLSRTIDDGGFDSEQNTTITWRHLLQQTSEWEGELFGIPDWIDRGRQVGVGATMSASSTVGGSASSEDDYRHLQSPGSFWEYNDVRVNRTALSLLRILQEPLPDYLKRELMDPIGASDSWQWHGYESSWVEVNGRQVQSVSGGAHWGGGLWISTLDHARFGLLYLNRGRWGNAEILPESWLTESLKPCELNPGYGFLWWLNHENTISDIADGGAFAARGAGGNIIFVWPAADVVITLRWCSDCKQAIDNILACLV